MLVVIGNNNLFSHQRGARTRVWVDGCRRHGRVIWVIGRDRSSGIKQGSALMKRIILDPSTFDAGSIIVQVEPKRIND